MNADASRHGARTCRGPTAPRAALLIASAAALVLVGAGSAQETEPRVEPLVVPPAGAAAEALPQPDCEAPIIPAKFLTREAQELFVVLVDEYQRCMRAFIEEQQRKSKLHADAGNAAAEQFNRFAAAAEGIEPAE